MKIKFSEFTCIVSSGPTREWLDPVRYISNASTGLMGYNIAKEALSKFKKTIYVCGPVCKEYQYLDGAENITVEKTEEMFEEIKKNLCSNCVLIKAAAPLDFKFKKFIPTKIKKNQLDKINYDFENSIDILLEIKKIAPLYKNFLRVGFAAQTENIENEAKEKLLKKELDLICANKVFKQDSGFGENESSMILLNKNGDKKEIGKSTKNKLAKELWEYIENQSWFE